MVEKLVDFLGSILSSEELIVLFVSALPISELRGAIPLSVVRFGFSPLKSYFLSVAGNMLPVIPILLFLEPIRGILSKIGFIDKFFKWLYERTYKRSMKVMKYGAIGLALFVAIPLPVTGAWTGCVAAIIFNIKLRWALPSIFLGVLIAGIVVLSLTVGIKELV